MASDVATPESITPAWLTAILREGGHAGAAVRAFRAGQIGTGQIGKCIRFELELTEGSGDAPRSVVGKFPSDDPTSRATGVQLGNYIKEVSFYRDLQARLTIRSPRCYHSAIAGVGPQFCL